MPGLSAGRPSGIPGSLRGITRFDRFKVVLHDLTDRFGGHFDFEQLKIAISSTSSIFIFLEVVAFIDTPSDALKMVDHN